MDPDPIRQSTRHISSGNQVNIPTQVMQDLLVAVLARGSSFRFRARGMSMMPFIKDGDLISIAPTTRIKPGIGRVVAYTHPGSGSLIVHRVVNRQGHAFLIAGDNSSGTVFDRVEGQAILGCVTRVERDGRRIYLGLGPERYLVSLFSRFGLLARFAQRFKRFKTLF